MKWMLLSIFLFGFVYMPMYFLDTRVLPELIGLKTTYTQSAQQAQDIANNAAYTLK